MSDENAINGEWKLIETLRDPGDGSGKFKSTDLNVTLRIDNVQDVEVNGVLCGIQESSELLLGTISIDNMTITAMCQSVDIIHNINFESSNLIISLFGCIEPCRAKFEKID